MTVNESIKMLQSMKYEDDIECSENIALDMAIKALEQQPCDNDCEHCEWVTCPKDEELEQQSYTQLATTPCTLEQLLSQDDMCLVSVASVKEALKQQPCEDCVSREAVLKILNDNYRKWFIADNGFIECVGDIKDLPSVTPQNQWHKVEDELPKEKGKYVVITKYGIQVGLWCGFKEDWKNVIAWMPLPEWKE